MVRRALVRREQHGPRGRQGGDGVHARQHAKEDTRAVLSGIEATQNLSENR